MKKVLLLLLAGAMLTMFGSCSKEGPAGPQGPAGVQGPAGPQGPAGKDGESGGSAGVMYSDWKVLSADDWETHSDGTLDFKWDVSEITQDVLDKGLVLIYGRMITDYALLPIEVDMSGATVRVQSSYKAGRITVEVSITMGGQTVPADPSSFGGILAFRYVILPGGANVGLAGSNVDISNYPAVARYFSIPDIEISKAARLDIR